MKELRTFTIRTDVSLDDSTGKKKIIGLIPYDSRSVDMGFYEVITKTAFNKTLADGTDVKALRNHDSTKILGRVGNGSLVLKSTDEGLLCECTLEENSQEHSEAYEHIRSNLTPGMSFGFYIDKEEVKIEGEEEVHYLREVELFEVSFCVPFPAYEEAVSVARQRYQIMKKRGMDIEQMEKVISKKEFSEEDFEYLRSIQKSITDLLPKIENTEAVAKNENTSAVAYWRGVADGLTKR